MSAPRMTSEEESRRVAEESRQIEWEGKGFLRDLFLGKLDLESIHPFPEADDSEEFRKVYSELESFLANEVDSAAIDQSGEYPELVVDGLRKLGCFGIKISKEYGGLGFTVTQYCKIMELVGSVDGNLVALLSAHQSIGLPQPLKLFGTEEQKQKYLPRCAAGAISAFALTEPHVGSDPSRLSTSARKEGNHFVLNGEKLWCTNGTLAELLVVMARDPDTGKINCFIVEANTPGVKVEYRCRFMGLKALGNGVISFTDVKLPRENLIGEEGKGLKYALITLNTGRLSLPASCSGMAKQCIEIIRRWSSERVQWGVPIWKHEAIAHEVADITATTFALDSVWRLAAGMADRGGYDIRLEAAAAKEWNTARGWDIIDRTLQIRGGRGYETETSLAGRGEVGVGIERMMRDSRINLIFEGSSEIMHLFMAREAVDKHLQVAGAMIEPKNGIAEKAAALPGILGFYVGWYPPLWFRAAIVLFKYKDFGDLAPHLRFVDRAARKLARESFHGMVFYRAKMERKQGFLFRLVDIAMELFAMSASVTHARQMRDKQYPEAARAEQLADLFCRRARRRVKQLFREVWSNDDEQLNGIARAVMEGQHLWLEEGKFDSFPEEGAFRTRAFTGNLSVDDSRRAVV